MGQICLGSSALHYIPNVSKILFYTFLEYTIQFCLSFHAFRDSCNSYSTFLKGVILFLESFCNLFSSSSKFLLTCVCLKKVFSNSEILSFTLLMLMVCLPLPFCSLVFFGPSVSICFCFLAGICCVVFLTLCEL